MTILDDAERLAATGPLCDACLGRPFAERSFGLGNDERGRALRTTLALDSDEPYESPDTEKCWVCEGLCGQFDAYADCAVAALEGIDFSTYQVGTRVPPLVEENGELLRADAGLDVDAGELLKSEFNREVGKRVGQQTGKAVGFERPDVQLLVDLDADEIEVTINSVAVYGRYRKVERDVPQTEWPCSNCGESGTLHGGRTCPECDGTGYRYRTSVEQEVAPPLVTALRGDEGVFHGAGREDVDALMLGDGRPFVLEVKRPHRRDVELATIEDEINKASDAVKVDDLRYATHEMTAHVKEHDASKTYHATVEFGSPVDETALEDALETLQGATVEQRTPHRVDHRRADLVREREVYSVNGDRTDDTHATIDVHGAGGLYIKELISSDDGRTEPSLAGLLETDATVTALDVLAVEGEDEPFEQPAYFRDE